MSLFQKAEVIIKYARDVLMEYEMNGEGKPEYIEVSSSLKNHIGTRTILGLKVVFRDELREDDAVIY